MNRPKIVFPDPDPPLLRLLTPELVAQVESFAAFEVYKDRPSGNEELAERIRDADGVILGWGMSNEVMDQCRKLKIISFTGIGVRNFVDVKHANERGVTVTNTPGYGDQSVAEHALALMFALAKNIPRNDGNLRSGTWDQSLESIELRGKTVGLIGIGGIGKRMGELCKAIGMNVIGWTRRSYPGRSEEMGFPLVSLEELLSTSDIISLHLPLTEDTRGFLGESELSKVKPGSLLINTARAELVDTPAMIRLLESGQLAGAGIDVYDEEPLPANHPLIGLPNVILTPHIGFNTQEAIQNILKIAIDNVSNFFRGNITNKVLP
jgi:D-3-phosphoglycerate dehydrogenase